MTLREQNTNAVETLDTLVDWINDDPSATKEDILRWIDYKRRGHKGWETRLS